MSLPLLRYELQKTRGKYRNILQKLETKFKISEYYYSDLNYNIDVDMESLKTSMIPALDQNDLDELLKIASKFQYPYILWNDYRCNLIHETKQPLDVNIKGHEVPFYANLTLLDESYDVAEAEQTQFRIPSIFIFETLSNCIKNFKDECIKNSVDPFVKAR